MLFQMYLILRNIALLTMPRNQFVPIYIPSSEMERRQSEAHRNALRRAHYKVRKIL